MVTVTLEDLKLDPKLVSRVQAGESFLVLDAGRPAIEIRPAMRPRTSPRPFGLCKGEFTVPDDFDEPLPREILESFEAP